MDVRQCEVGDNEHALIIGRYSLQSYLRFVKSKCTGGTEMDERLLTQEWREIQRRAAEADVAEAGVADAPAFIPLPDEMIPIAQEVRNREATQKTFSSYPLQWWLVEIDRAVVFQPWVNLSYVRELQATLAKPLSDTDHIRFASGTLVVKPKVLGSYLSDDRYVFTSSSTDVRFLGSALLEPDAVDHQPLGYPTHVVAIFIGSSVNCLSAIHVNNRLILINGTHRAYALRELGFTHVACLVTHVANDDERSRVLPAAVKQDEARYLDSRRPPLFKDYFDPSLRKVLPAVTNSMVLRLKLKQSTEAIRTS